MQKKRNVIWQVQGMTECEWIKDVFCDDFGKQIFDGSHRVVMDYCLLIDSYLAHHPSDYYARFKGKDAFLVHLSDEAYSGGYSAYSCFRGVFRNYWSSVFYPGRVFTLPLGYGNGLKCTANLPPASHRRYSWTFLGQLSKASRPDMARALSLIMPNFCHATDAPHCPVFPHAEYQFVLLNSTFAPCPMGNVNLDSFRVYEALEAGSIPIVEKRLTLDYFRQLFGKHPLPTVNRWGEARALIYRLIKQPKTLDVLQQQCVEWWKDYKSNLGARVAAFLHQPATRMHLEPATSFWPNLPFWRALELCRHHSFRALIRRVELQVKRLFPKCRLLMP